MLTLPILALLSIYGVLHDRFNAQHFHKPQLLSITKHNVSTVNGVSSVSARTSQRTMATEFVTHSLTRTRLLYIGRRINSVQSNFDKF